MSSITLRETIVLILLFQVIHHSQRRLSLSFYEPNFLLRVRALFVANADFSAFFRAALAAPPFFAPLRDQALFSSLPRLDSPDEYPNFAENDFNGFSFVCDAIGTIFWPLTQSICQSRQERTFMIAREKRSDSTFAKSGRNCCDHVHKKTILVAIQPTCPSATNSGIREFGEPNFKDISLLFPLGS